MASFIIYDLVFLVLFTIFVIVFLYKRRKNLQRQGLLYLYRTKLGIKFIEWTSKKFPKTLFYMQFLVITSGYILMVSMIYLLIRFSYIYLTSPIIAKAIKVPVILPLIPYLPAIFKLDFLPPFYFTYWIVILAIVAIPHEFAHGIFARINKIRIHSTGFGFLGPFLAAFVEPDEKQMEKSKKFPQLSILAAGTFANIIFTIFFIIILWIFFTLAYTPAGVNFNSYATVGVQLSTINTINNQPVSSINNIQDIINQEEEYTEIEVQGLKFISLTQNLLIASENNINTIPAILDSPAYRSNLLPESRQGIIQTINNIAVTNINELRSQLQLYKAGDTITIQTIDAGEKKYFTIELDEYDGKAFLGIATIPLETRGVIGAIYSIATKIKDPSIYYESNLGNLGVFIYNLLWWTILISISVALVNMLPLGIFDGGRFFYLTVWAITGSKSIGQKSFKVSTWILLLLITALMIKWIFTFT